MDSQDTYNYEYLNPLQKANSKGTNDLQCQHYLKLVLHTSSKDTQPLEKFTQYTL